ncbi:TetR/AcrR family transcriptional regulator C-terminal domain-containing protein [Streptomonospora sediminis]
MSTGRQAEIARVAVELLDAKGADSVSLRAVAERLGVRLNTVSWHVGTKAALLELMADHIVGEIPLDALPPEWEPRVRELLGRYRSALLAHRDGAAVVAGTYAARPKTLGVADTLAAGLLDGGFGEAEAAWACWTLIYFTLGLSMEEQGAPFAPAGKLAGQVDPGDTPALARVLPHLGAGTFGERHEFGLDLILSGLRSRAGSQRR